MSDPTTTPPHATYNAEGGAPAPATMPPAAKPAARWEDFIDIFYAPSQVFARREHSGFGIPMLVVTLVGAALFFATFNALSPVLDAEFSRNAAAAIRKGATPEMMERGRAVGEKLMKVMIFVAPPVIMFLTGLALWLCGKLVGARQTLNAAIMVAAYASVPRLIGTLASGVQAMLMDPATLNGRHRIALDMARFMDPDTTSPLLVAIAGRFDVFTIWLTVLLGIGLAVTGKIPRSRVYAAAALVFVLGSMVDVLSALRR